MFERFIEHLERRLKQELPGEDKQFLMAPHKRERLNELSLQNRIPRGSAVLIILYSQDKEIRTVLIERPVYDGFHSGQVAFPGGKFEEEDVTLEQTALRETYEEIGVNPEVITIIGRLTNLYISPSNFLVSPVIGFMNSIPVFKPNEREVARIITISLRDLNDLSIKGVKTITHSNGIKIKTPYYEVEGLTVWGATAMIISELNAVVEEVNSIF